MNATQAGAAGINGLTVVARDGAGSRRGKN
jgi:hypothetical protein